MKYTKPKLKPTLGVLPYIGTGKKTTPTKKKTKKKTMKA